MSRPSEAEYHDLNGEECFEILHSRFYDLLKDLPELQRRFTLTRVILRLQITLDIAGSTPPRKIYQDQLTVNVTDPVPAEFVTAEAHYDLNAEANSLTNPPDQVREDHGLLLPRGIRGHNGITETQHLPAEDEPKYQKPPEPIPAHLLPANQASPTAKRDGRRTYASFVTQDYGSYQVGERKGDEGPIVGAEKIADAGAGGGGDHAPVQVDFRLGNYHGPDETKPAAIVEETIRKGMQIDQELADRDRPKPRTNTPPPRSRKK